MRSVPGKVAAALAIASTLATLTSSAQTSDQLVAARRGLLSDAQAASARGDHAQALDLATRAGRIEMTPSIRLFLAQEQQFLGQLVEAMGSADACVREAEAQPNLRNRESILASCRLLVSTIGPRLGSVIVRMPASAPADATVRVGAATLPAVLYGAPFRVTPGTVAIDVSAAHVAPFHREVSVAAGASVDVPVELTPIAEPVASAAPSSPSPPPANVASSSPAPAPIERTTQHVSPAPVVVMVTGVGIAAIGVVLTVFANLRVSQINRDNCVQASPGNYLCDPSAQSEYNTAVTIDTAGITAMIVGAVTVAGGAAWFLVAHRPSEREHASIRRWRFGLMPQANGAFATIGGAF